MPPSYQTLLLQEMKWVYGYNPATKQMSQWAVLSPRWPKKPRQVKNQDNPVHFPSCGGSGASWISSLMLQMFIFHHKSVFWYLDTVPQQCAMSSGPGWQGVFGEAQQPSGFPSDLPDLVPCKFFLFPRLSVILKGKRFWGCRDTTGYDKVVASHSETGLPHMH